MTRVRSMIGIFTMTLLLQVSLQHNFFMSSPSPQNNLSDTSSLYQLPHDPFQDNGRETLSASTKKVRFGNYFRSEDRNVNSKIIINVPDNSTASQLNKLLEVQYQKVTNYIQVDYSLDWVLVVSPTGGYLNQTLSNGLVTTIIIYGVGIPKTLILTDIESPMTLFTSISDQVTVTTPYSNNTFWRVVVLYNGECQLLREVSRREVISDPQDWRKIRFPNSLRSEPQLSAPMLRVNYFLDDSYSAKDIRLNISSPGGESILDVTLTDIKLHRFGVYTLIYSKELQKDSFTVVSDFVPNSPYPAVAFTWLYALLWVVMRKLRQVNISKRGRTFYYQPKSIRVRNIEDKTLSSTMQLDQIDYIDTFRGLMIVLMIFIRTGGSNSWLLHQSVWNGFSLGDLPKYSISWILGFCVPISHVRIDPSQQKWKYFKNYLTRFLIMAVLGKMLLTLRLHLQQERGLEIVEVDGIPPKTRFLLLLDIHSVSVRHLQPQEKERVWFRKSTLLLQTADHGCFGSDKYHGNLHCERS